MIDEERLATAMVAAFREVATKHWPHLRGDGWPAYEEHGSPAQVFIVSEIAAAVAREYEVRQEQDVDDAESMAAGNFV